MPKVKLHICDERMLYLMQYLIDTKTVSKITSKRSFAEAIGIAPANLSKAERAEQSFTVKQIAKAAIKFKVNVNWVFGLEKDMFRNTTDRRREPIVMLKDAVAAVEAQLKV